MACFQAARMIFNDLLTVAPDTRLARLARQPETSLAVIASIGLSAFLPRYSKNKAATL